MDYIRRLGTLVLDHRFRRMTEALLRTADEVYAARGLDFRARWASTFTILRDEGPTPVGVIAERLRLTHPGVIGITDEMIDAGIVAATRDRGDGRRRILALTAKGRQMIPQLTSIWEAMSSVQARRFKRAGCDIVKVLDAVEDGMAERSLASEVLGTVRTVMKTSPVRKTTSSRKTRVVAGMLAILAATIPLHRVTAQTPPAITAVEKAALIRVLSDSLIGGYIYEKTGRMLADSLGAELRSGAYDAFTTGDAFAARVNQTLKRVANDRHLGVSHGPRPPAGSGLVRRRVPPGTAPGTAAPTHPVFVTATAPMSAAAEQGFASVQILPGNIGYIELRGFSGDPAAIHVADSVMALFANVSALIIDVGRNRGGGPELIRHLSAYLFDKPTHLASSFARGMDAPMERWTSPSVPGKRLPKTPVYVLTSRSTISAAESFIFGLKNHDRITIVGERTAGGGHFGAFVPLTPGFTVFLPRGRTYNPRTNEGWEAEGLKPDVEVPYDKALETALALTKNIER